MQEVQRAASTTEFLARAHRSRLCCEYVGHQLLLAKLGGRIGLKVEIRAVQSAINLRQLAVHVADLEITPLAVVVAPGHAHVKFAHARRHLFDGTVVTVGRVVKVRVDAAEQGIRRFLHEVGEQILKRTLARIGARRQFPVFTELAIDEKRQATVEVGFEIVVAVLTLHQLSRAVHRILRDGQVGHADVEPVVLLELEVA